MDEKSGTFLVTHADEGSAVLRAIADDQVHALSANPGLEPGEAIEATIAPEPPLEATWEVREIDDRRTLRVERSEETPTRRALEIGAEQSVGEVAREERAGTGEVHVITVSPGETDAAVADVVEDETTLVRAARYGVARVEVRADEESGVVSVRYLP